MWSEGEVATFPLDLPEKPAGSVQLDVPCCGDRHPESTEQGVWRTIDVRSDLLETRRIEVRFLWKGRVAAALGSGRRTTLGLSAFKVRCADGRLANDGTSDLMVRRRHGSIAP